MAHRIWRVVQETNIFLLVIFILLFGLWDTGTTLMAHGADAGFGEAREINPAVRSVLSLGVTPFLTYKLMLSAIVIGALFTIREHRQVLKYFLVLADLVLFMVVVSNVRIILLLQ